MMIIGFDKWIYTKISKNQYGCCKYLIVVNLGRGSYRKEVPNCTVLNTLTWEQVVLTSMRSTPE